MINITDTTITINEETVDNNDVLRHIIAEYGCSTATKAAALRAMLDEIKLPWPREVIRKSGEWMLDKELTERFGITVVDGRKVASPDNAQELYDFKEIVMAIYGSMEQFGWLSGCKGSSLSGGVMFIGADVPEKARLFTAFHEFRHGLDGAAYGIVRPLLAHASARSSRAEKECDRFALVHILDEEDDLSIIEKTIEWMVCSHFRCENEHPRQVSDFLYRAIVLYRLARLRGKILDIVFDMRKLQKSKRWWG